MTINAAGFVIFAIGVAAGSAITWKYAKEKYARIAQEEIDSVKETFSNRRTKIQEKTPEQSKPGVVEYAAKLRNMRYTNYSDPDIDSDVDEPDCDENKEDKMPVVKKNPYVIAPEEFGEIDYYEQITLTYYADNVLTNDDDEVLDNVEDVVGLEALTKFGEYEDDSVFVRNERFKCDYEILLDLRNYSDVSEKH